MAPSSPSFDPTTDISLGPLMMDEEEKEKWLDENINHKFWLHYNSLHCRAVLCSVV